MKDGITQTEPALLTTANVSAQVDFKLCNDISKSAGVHSVAHEDGISIATQTAANLETATQEVQTSKTELPAAPLHIPPEGSLWKPLDGKTLQVGDIVKAQKQIWSGNASASIQPHRVGKVAKFDVDMDVCIIFPGEVVEEHWILKADLG